MTRRGLQNWNSIITAQVASETHLRIQWGLFESKADEAGLDVVGGAGVPFFWALALAALRAAPLLSLLLALLSFDGDNALSLENTKIFKYQNREKK